MANFPAIPAHLVDRGVGFDRHRDHDQRIARNNVLVRIVIAYAIWEGAAIVLSIVRVILFWFVKKGFFWLIDVVPAKAKSVAEAKEMVVAGPMAWLGKKFMTDFGNCTEDDTEQLASLMNWRGGRGAIIGV